MEDNEGMPDTKNAGTIPFEQLKFEEEVGAGSFGSVYRGTYLGNLSFGLFEINKNLTKIQELLWP